MTTSCAKGLTFADPGPSTFDLRPGTIGFTTTRVTSGWGTWTSLAVYTAGSEGEARTISTAGGLSGSAWAMAPDVSYAVAYYWSNEAAEYRFPSAAPVTPGADAGVTAAFKEGSAFRMWIAKPYWWSGKPGSSLELHYSNWPAGTAARFLGAPGYPSSATATTFGGKHLTSAGTKEAVTKVTVPSTVKPGYAYTVEMYRPEDPVWIDLSVRFQVCTLNASRTSVRSGGSGEAQRRGARLGPRGHPARRPRHGDHLPAHDCRQQPAHGLGRDHARLAQGRAPTRRRVSAPSTPATCTPRAPRGTSRATRRARRI